MQHNASSKNDALWARVRASMNSIAYEPLRARNIRKVSVSAAIE